MRIEDQHRQQLKLLGRIKITCDAKTIDYTPASLRWFP